jgi:hypothetical protein
VWVPRRGLAGIAGLVLGVIVLGPALAPGFVLTYDMVFVPDPPVTSAMFGLTGGFPRPAPSDAVVAALAFVLPADLAQKLILLSIFVLGSWGAARLVPSTRTLPRLAAAVFYMWNPYVAERLLLGHWALLLGYAGLPWAARAALTVGERGGATRLTRSLLPAAAGGFAAMNISALVVISTVVVRAAFPRDLAIEQRSASTGEGGRREGIRALVRALLVIGGLSLPWLVPAILRDAGSYGTDPGGVDLFAARADTPFGSLGSLLSLGGIWNREVVPPGLDAWPGAAARLALSLIALGFFVAYISGRVGAGRHPMVEDTVSGDAVAGDTGGDGAIGPSRFRGLAAAAGLGLLIACLGITEPGRDLLRWLTGLWPGFGVMRDAQLWIAPLALAEAVGLALAVTLVQESPQVQKSPRRAEARVLAGLAVIAPVVLLPTFAGGIAGRLDSVRYPAEWATARRIIDQDPVPGAVLSLPWAAHRPLAWNAGRTTLDPLWRAVSRRVVWNDGLRVDGVELASEDPAARAAGEMLRKGDLRKGADQTEALRRAGYRYVVVARTGPGDNGLNENTFPIRLTGAPRVLHGTHVDVYRIDSPARFEDVGRPPRPPVLTGDLIVLLLMLWSFGASGSNLLARRTRQ